MAFRRRTARADRTLEREKIIALAEEDNLEEFKIYNMEYYEMDENLLDILLGYNIGNISMYMCSDKDLLLVYSDYEKIINSHIEKNRNKLVLFIMNTFVYADLTGLHYRRLINKFAKYKLWELVDYLHISGHKAFDERNLIELYPKKGLQELELYGYELKQHEMSEEELLEKNISKITLDEFKNYKNAKSDLIIISLCKNKRIDILQYLLDSNKEFKLLDEHTAHLFGIEKKINKKNKKKRRSMRGQSWRYRRECYNFINSDKIDHIVDFLKENKDRIILPSDQCQKIMLFCIKHNIYHLFADQFKKEKYTNKIHMKVVGWLEDYFIKNDKPEGLKYLIEHNFLEPLQIYKQTSLVDIAIVNGYDNLYNYLTKELHMTYSRSFFSKYDNFYRGMNAESFIKKVEELEIPIDSKFINFAIKSSELIDYVIKKKVNFTNKHVILALRGGNIRTVTKLLKLGCKVNKDKIIKQFLGCANFRRYYGGGTRSKVIKYLIKKHDAKISEEDMNVIVRYCDEELTDLLFEKFPEIFKKWSINDYLNKFYRADAKDIVEKVVKINPDILNMSYSEKFELLTRFIETSYLTFEYFYYKTNFHFKFPDNKIVIGTNENELPKYCVYGLEEDKCLIKFIEILEKDGVIVTHEFIEYYIKYSYNTKHYDYLFKKYKFDFTLKFLNQCIVDYAPIQKITYITNKIKPSPYTILLLTEMWDRYCDFDELTILIKKTGITQEGINNLKNVRGMKPTEIKFINKLKPIEYEALADEIVERNMRIYDDDETVDDELEQAIREGIIERPVKEEEIVDELEGAIEGAIEEAIGE